VPESPPPGSLPLQSRPGLGAAQKSGKREDIREPKKGQINSGKNISFHLRTNPG
jgi:hypothetical protein